MRAASRSSTSVSPSSRRPEGAASSATNLPTETRGTEPGVVMGTSATCHPSRSRVSPPTPGPTFSRWARSSSRCSPASARSKGTRRRRPSRPSCGRTRPISRPAIRTSRPAWSASSATASRRAPSAGSSPPGTSPSTSRRSREPPGPSRQPLERPRPFEGSPGRRSPCSRFSPASGPERSGCPVRAVPNRRSSSN